MIHYWMLLYVIGTLIQPSCSNTIAGFPTEKDCESARAQLIAKLQPKKSACIAVTQGMMTVTPQSPPVEEQQ